MGEKSGLDFSPAQVGGTVSASEEDHLFSKGTQGLADPGGYVWEELLMASDGVGGISALKGGEFIDLEVSLMTWGPISGKDTWSQSPKCQEGFSKLGHSGRRQ